MTLTPQQREIVEIAIDLLMCGECPPSGYGALSQAAENIGVPKEQIVAVVDTIIEERQEMILVCRVETWNKAQADAVAPLHSVWFRKSDIIQRPPPVLP